MTTSAVAGEVGPRLEQRPPPGRNRILKDWQYTIGIRIFQSENRVALSLSELVANHIPANEPIAGVLCQAARGLLAISQQDLKALSGISKKSINDFENSFSELRPELILKLRGALEGEGAQFFAGDGYTGVVVGLPRGVVDERSRSPNRRSGTVKLRSNDR